MTPSVTLEKFQGPLDLLLRLIQEEQLTITDISLSHVTEQFFAYLNKLSEKDAEELADFLVIASKLVFLKSRTLLPYLYPAEENGPSLADQLKLYKRYADASQLVEKLWTQEKIAYGRIEPPVPVEGFVMPLNAKVNDLQQAFVILLKRLEPVAVLPQVAIDRTVSVKEKIASIYKALQHLKKLAFTDIIERARNRTEVIVSFLAILELVKQEQVAVKQDHSFHNFTLQKA